MPSKTVTPLNFDRSADIGTGAWVTSLAPVQQVTLTVTIDKKNTGFFWVYLQPGNTATAQSKMQQELIAVTTNPLSANVHIYRDGAVAQSFGCDFASGTNTSGTIRHTPSSAFWCLDDASQSASTTVTYDIYLSTSNVESRVRLINTKLFVYEL